MIDAKVVVPWVTMEEIDMFLEAWGAEGGEPWLILQQDEYHEGCGVTKNKGVAAAVAKGAEVVVILDGDCYPDDRGAQSLLELVGGHLRAMRPQSVCLYRTVTSPPSRGTPYFESTVLMEVAASMGFWTDVGDYCAVRQLAHKAAPMSFIREPIHGQYFPLCGMNLAFRPAVWHPWCEFIDVARFDDIWMGWLWQRHAYQHRYCFNLAGPLVRHSRQSNVWKNLKAEALYLEENETLWRDIAMSSADDYDTLRSLLPC